MHANIRKLRRPGSGDDGGDNRSRSAMRFTTELLQAFRKDIVSQRIPLKKLTISDSERKGLRAIVRDTGLITFMASYRVGTEQPFMRVGYFPTDEELKKHPKSGQTAIDDARKLTATIIELGNKGIDVQLGLHERLLSELREKGPRWKP